MNKIINTEFTQPVTNLVNCKLTLINGYQIEGLSAIEKTEEEFEFRHERAKKLAHQRAMDKLHVIQDYLSFITIFEYDDPCVTKELPTDEFRAYHIIPPTFEELATDIFGTVHK